MRLYALALLAALAACGSASTVDGGPADAGPADSGAAHDAGPTDAGPTDAGPSDAGPTDAGCTPGGDGGYVHAPYSTISQYCLVSLASDGGIAFNPAVTPYDLNTPLFSDYALKVRGVWLPPGTHAEYDDAGPFEFPPGTVLIKNFGFRDDLRKPSPDVRWVETRLLIDVGDAGWKGYAYVWNDAGTEANINYAGEVVPLSWLDGDGGTVQAHYLVPSYGQCQQCHVNGAVMSPIGPKARELNKSYPYESGAENQLTHWSRVGILQGGPSDPGQAPRLPVWNDPSTGTLAERARAYLEANCAHCHSAGGYARTTGLFLWASETDSTTYGICKPPVAAGPATGGNPYDIVPGDPVHSIVIYRLTSTTPNIAMPLIGRSVVDVEGLELVTDWIDSLDGGCP